MSSQLSDQISGFRFIVDLFQQYFSYIVAVNFIGGGNGTTQRKPLMPDFKCTEIVKYYFTT
jgi:hypothetical protein